MERKIIQSLKGCRTRFSKKANPVTEKKTVSTLVDKLGGYEKSVELLKDSPELLEYVMKVLLEAPSESSAESPVEEATVKTPVAKTVSKSEEEGDPIHISKDGKLYTIDTVKKTCKRIYKDLADLNIEDMNFPDMTLQVYQRFLKDKYPNESVQMKKDKLHFRGYRLSISKESGFLIEDIAKQWAIVEHGFEGIPTPKELGEFFERPRIEHTPEELAEAYERGKEAKKSEHAEKEEIDYEKFRKAVLARVRRIQTKKEIHFDPEDFPTLIPHKKWKRKVNAAFKEWKTRKIRYPKLLEKIFNITSEMVFEEEEDTKTYYKFEGTMLPAFKNVERLSGNKLEVDGKMIEAVPFMLEYLLHYEPKAMPQIMRFAKGEIDYVTLIKNPYHEDKKIEYNKKTLPNTEFNARVLNMVFESVGIVPPQDLVYDNSLQVGDKILIAIDGEWKTRQISSTEFGVCLSREVGLLKLDKWIPLPKKEEENENL